jgi:alpha-D-xyloside xylohydrolase
MRAAHEKGTPVMRTLFYEFPKDPKCWEVEDQYMYGDLYLCCPVLYPGQQKKKVYLPKGTSWRLWHGKEIYEGGQELEVECPIDLMPVFVKQ